MTTTLELNAKQDIRLPNLMPTFRDKRDHEFYEYILNDIPDMDLELFNLINGEGIENVDQWDDAYEGSLPTSIRVEAQFVEQLMEDTGYLDGPEITAVPNFLTDHIDWQEVWDCELRHDYFTIEHDGQTHFFSRYF